MRYEILGPVNVSDGGEGSSISARKIELVLAVLLIRVGQVVSVDQLIREVWGDRPPRRAVAALHVYISQLRKFLDRPGRPENPILTQSPGYLLRLGSDELDLCSFQDLASCGREHARAQRYEEAAASLSAALSLLRGPVPDPPAKGPIVEGFAAWLSEARIECVEMLVDSRLMLGRHRELVGPLYSLTAEYPLREVFYRQLMLALYRSQRRADALQVYQSVRKTLRDELGLEPDRTLREVHQAILMTDGSAEPYVAV